MVGSVGLLVAALVYAQWRLRLNSAIWVAVKWLGRTLIDRKTCQVAETFCNESAVLWFVFPLLDTIYEHRTPDLRLLHEAYEVAGMFFLFAVVLSHAGKSTSSPQKED